MTIPLYPSITEDSGDGISGTEGNKSWFEDFEDAITVVVHSTTNPTETPADIIDEVVAARGSLSSLDDRLSVGINDDGTFKAQSAYVTKEEARSLSVVNFFYDSDLLLWDNTPLPFGWSKSGTGVALSRTGAGESDTTPPPFAGFCFLLTYGSSDAIATKTLIPAAMVNVCDGIKGRKVTIGCYCQASTADQVCIIADDGVTTTQGGADDSGGTHLNWHTGSGNWEWIYVVHEMDSAATKLDVKVKIVSSGAAYFGNFFWAPGDLGNLGYIPGRYSEIAINKSQLGNLISGATKLQNLSTKIPWEARFDWAEGYIDTAPTTQAAIWQVEYNGNEMFLDAGTARPQAAATANDIPKKTANCTYYKRCAAAGSLFKWYCDQTGTGTTGANADLVFVFTVPNPPLAWLERRL